MASERLYETKSEVSIEFAKRNLNRYAFSSPEETESCNTTYSTPEKSFVTPAAAKIHRRRLAIRDLSAMKNFNSPCYSPKTDDEHFARKKELNKDNLFNCCEPELGRPLKSRSRLNRINKNSRVVRRLFPDAEDENNEYTRLLSIE
ncbi:unnamed protein product [Dimorphilus gyrociliatus]|uniref:Uncharacterized protein n=1 Tax=Dimorphilus gyrociliatus TaxID=2664684 RepID=A0A7I8V816_9ANNE|nr:unnamed protein product [Dimorphilus gyrociliatus]